jgi:hypothetical protein
VRRWRLHRIRLRQGKHHNRHLQNAWNAYGPDAFEFRKLVPGFCRLWGISDKTVTTRLKAGESIGAALRPPRTQGALV